jgi:bacterioferritin-associated ferredoxin
MDSCDEMAMILKMVPEPWMVGIDPAEVDQEELNALCEKAHIKPDKIVCTCTLTRANEIAAAILKGAKSIEDVSRMTGTKGYCGLWCVAPVERLLRAHGVEFDSCHGKWYHVDASLWNIPENVVQKYPEYRIKEDQELASKGIMDDMTYSWLHME